MKETFYFFDDFIYDDGGTHRLHSFTNKPIGFQLLTVIVDNQLHTLNTFGGRISSRSRATGLRNRSPFRKEIFYKIYFNNNVPFENRIDSLLRFFLARNRNSGLYDHSFLKY